MRISVSFQEQTGSFNPHFGEVHNVTDGGYERGYAKGYEAGSDDLAKEFIDRKVFSSNAITALPANAFRTWGYLTELNLPNCLTVGAYACYNATGLKSINLPKVTAVDTSGLRQCTSATTINLAACTSLGQTALQKCTALEIIDLPRVSSIGASAFYQCSVLTSVILRSTAVCTLAYVNAFTDTPIASGTGYIYVPDDLVDSYKAATNWSTYAAQIRALSELPNEEEMT